MGAAQLPTARLPGKGDAARAHKGALLSGKRMKLCNGREGPGGQEAE